MPKMRFGPRPKTTCSMKTYRFVFQSGMWLSVSAKNKTEAKKLAYAAAKPEDGRLKDAD
jgi:hypothetical protein